MPCQPRHLGEIAHGRFAGISLPVGVGGKARGRVKCQVRRHRAEILRIERQNMLPTLDAVSDEQSDRAEDQHTQSVLLPVLLLLGIHAAKLIEQSLYRSEQARQRFLISFEDPKHIQAEGLRYGEN